MASLDTSWRGDRNRIDACLDEISRLQAENAWLRAHLDLSAEIAARGEAAVLLDLALFGGTDNDTDD